MRSLYSKATVIVLLSLTLLSCSENDAGPENPAALIGKVVNPYIMLNASVGIIVGIVNDGQTAIYSYGETKLGSKEKIKPESILEIASLTKTYTALALAVMHEKGILHLDDPIENYFPASVRVPSFNGKKITLRHLAKHTSGFPRYPSNMDKEAYNMYKGYTKEKMYDFVNGYSLTREPGSVQEYSNVGFGLLGEILSLVNGSDYEAVVFKYVLQPLEMRYTTVSFTADQQRNLVPGHHGNKEVESWSGSMQDIFQGTGSLISSMEDQMIYLKTNMGLVNSPLESAINLIHPSLAGGPDSIGMAWNKKDFAGMRIITKNGGNGGYGSFMGFDKEKKIGVVVLANSSLNPDLFPTDIGFEILKVLDKLE